MSAGWSWTRGLLYSIDCQWKNGRKKHHLAVPFNDLAHLKFMYLILNEKIVIHPMHIQGMSDFLIERKP